ncbi:MAG: hypothetical protein L0Z50_40930 [Verrucomicrobiales bacterium]|nr:hypothetical protein [Verrucomicrobiales bacterium]
MNTKNSLSLVIAETSALPERIVTHWRRFSSGLWRVPEGDIQAAYCADTFPKIKVFMHKGRLFTNCGGHFSGAVRAAADCYPLIPADEYRGPEPARYTYEGREAAYQGQVFKLGRKVVFEASDPSIGEWRRLLRVLYADGGMFAHGVTYFEFLDQRLSPKSENEKAAHFKELAECGCGSMPRTQTEMRRLLEGDRDATARGATQQMDFGL